MLPLLMEHGATSKNARTRAESLEEVAHPVSYTHLTLPTILLV